MVLEADGTHFTVLASRPDFVGKGVEATGERMSTPIADLPCRRRESVEMGWSRLGTTHGHSMHSERTQACLKETVETLPMILGSFKFAIASRNSKGDLPYLSTITQLSTIWTRQSSCEEY